MTTFPVCIYRSRYDISARAKIIFLNTIVTKLKKKSILKIGCNWFYSQVVVGGNLKLITFKQANNNV